MILLYKSVTDEIRFLSVCLNPFLLLMPGLQTFSVGDPGIFEDLVPGEVEKSV